MESNTLVGSKLFWRSFCTEGGNCLQFASCEVLIAVLVKIQALWLVMLCHWACVSWHCKGS